MRDLMARLGRRIARQLRNEERGAIGIIVAVLIGCGVLTGMGALVVDVGQLYQERAELQDGADAAAIGVAKSCALGVCDPTVASQYADANASSLTGGNAAASLVCGSGTGLTVCPASTGALTDCPAPPPGVNYVDVTTSTQTASGSTVLPPAFAATLLGTSYSGTTVTACSQAAWGAPSSATTTAVTISACEWDQATAQGTSFAPGPPYPPDPAPAPAFDQVLTLNTGASSGGCATEPAGADAPGSFGWANHPRGNCTVPISAPSFAARTRTAASFSCLLVLQNAQANQIPLLLPIYVSMNGLPGNPTYVLQGFADFVVTGYNLPGIGPGFSASDWLNSANDCTGTNYCLNGYFVQGVIPSTGALAGTNLGASVIDLTG
jgi:Flp pilus assembly protein TadG